MRASRKLVLALSTAEQRAAEARDYLRSLRFDNGSVPEGHETLSHTARVAGAMGNVDAWEEAVEMLKALQ